MSSTKMKMTFGLAACAEREAATAAATRDHANRKKFFIDGQEARRDDSSGLIEDHCRSASENTSRNSGSSRIRYQAVCTVDIIFHIPKSGDSEGNDDRDKMPFVVVHGVYC
jgi:hypothetical protein